jgi:hypothetical protein
MVKVEVEVWDWEAAERMCESRSVADHHRSRSLALLLGVPHTYRLELGTMRLQRRVSHAYNNAVCARTSCGVDLSAGRCVEDDKSFQSRPGTRPCVWRLCAALIEGFVGVKSLLGQYCGDDGVRPVLATTCRSRTERLGPSN